MSDDRTKALREVQERVDLVDAHGHRFVVLELDDAKALLQAARLRRRFTLQMEVGQHIHNCVQCGAAFTCVCIYAGSDDELCHVCSPRF